MSISIGLVGLGLFGREFAEYYKRHPLVSRIALCDREPERIAAFANKPSWRDKFNPRDAYDSIDATDFLRHEQATSSLPIGYFGASTGAAAALVAAAQRPPFIRAIISRGGRPDLADSSLPRVRAPTLLIVGGTDVPVISLNRQAMAQMRCTRQLQIIPGATHLFEEPGALERVAELAQDWFAQYLRLS